MIWKAEAAVADEAQAVAGGGPGAGPAASPLALN
jgi:hypothetical protein